MEAFLGTISQHAMNYAIRSGIGLTASFTIGQASRLLKTIEDQDDRKEFQRLRGLLDVKTKIVSPAIDLIELISARGNTILETAVTLTKELRWEIQSLGVRIQKTAGVEELAQKGTNRVKSRAAHAAEIREIIQDIRNLISQIEEHVPFINLAITTSGVSLSTTLPPTVSPSRLLQASAFLNEGDLQYVRGQGSPVQIGPAFTLTLYMLFAGHSYRSHDEETNSRETTWKEVVHKARVKLMRSSGIEASLSPNRQGGQSRRPKESIERDSGEIPIMPGEEFQSNYYYHLEIVEDLDDDRVHSFEDDEPQPGPYEGVELAGIREKMPVFQVSRIFYADTGRVLGIGNEGEINNPVLLLKRDVNALPPRSMMRKDERPAEFDDHLEDQLTPREEEYDSQEDIDEQIRRESSVHLPEEVLPNETLYSQSAWRLPSDLDPEWMAFEIYTEAPDSDSEDGHNANGDSFISHLRISDEGDEDSLTEVISNLHMGESLNSSPATNHTKTPMASFSGFTQSHSQHFSALPPVRSSISLLEMLLRLTTCQQFVQKSHLTITDETLTFFLEENASTGAGGNDAERQKTRQAAKSKIGFDPYNASPIKRRVAPLEEQDDVKSSGQTHQEEISYTEHRYDSRYSPRETPYNQDRRYGFSRGATPYSDLSEPRMPSPSLQGTPEWLRRTREEPSKNTPEFLPSSPTSPYRRQKKTGGGPLDRVQRARGSDGVKGRSWGRGASVDTDSPLGTSPGSPTLVNRVEKV